MKKNVFVFTSSFMVGTLVSTLSLMTMNASAAAVADDVGLYQGSLASEVWEIVKTGPYQTLPYNQVTLSSFFDWGVNVLRDASKRTINVKDDILPPFKKLLHPNGICLKGTWIIDKDTPYTGYFKNGSEGIIIARASVALSETTQGNYRGFGLAGKIYPTSDFYHQQKLKTANFFTIDDLTGTLTANYTKAEMTNEPNISFRLSSIALAPIAAAAATALGSVDINPGIRQLYEISELGESEDSLQNIKTPKWMMLSASEDTAIINSEDFRDEIAEHIAQYGKLIFDIKVADRITFFGRKQFITIGKIIFDDLVASSGCDTRLHFHHPPFRFGI